MDLAEQHSALDILRDVGFKNVSQEQIGRIWDHFDASNRRFMMVMSHTTTHDFLLGLLLFGATSIPVTMFTDFKTPLLSIVGKRIGMIPRKEGCSNTDAIISHLKNKRQFGLLISLAKTELNQKVHSGYFYIAQALQLPIIVLGFDYFLKSGYVSVERWTTQPGETYASFQRRVEPAILDEIGRICPLKPQFQVGFDMDVYRSIVPDCPHDVVLTAPHLGLLLSQVAGREFPIQTAIIIAIAVAFLILIFILACIVTRKVKTWKLRKANAKVRYPKTEKTQADDVD